MDINICSYAARACVRVYMFDTATNTHTLNAIKETAEVIKTEFQIT